MSTIGLPSHVKEAGRRVDFRPDEFTLAIETKGYRLAWARGAVCPCRSVDGQTEQPDPLCPLCKGIGWLYFGDGVASPSIVGELSPTQQAIIAKDGSSVIRGIMTRLGAQPDPRTDVGSWQSGESRVTVRPENQLGYYDRLVNLDAETTYAEVVKAGEASQPLELRYFATKVNLLRTQTTVYQLDQDYHLVAGRVVWLSGGAAPAEGERLAAHYLMHPTWLVIEYPHMIRETPLKYKTASPITPQGDPTALPIQALVRYEFLV